MNTEIFKPVVEELLHVPPPGPGLPALQAPVVHKHIVQHHEAVSSHKHLIGLKYNDDIS